jgi:hypothetical protein
MQTCQIYPGSGCVLLTVGPHTTSSVGIVGLPIITKTRGVLDDQSVQEKVKQEDSSVVPCFAYKEYGLQFEKGLGLP